MKRLVALVLAIGALLVVSACGGGDDGKGTIDVSESEWMLDPAKPTIDKVGPVEFKAKNDGNVIHALEVEGPTGKKRTGYIQPGKSASLKVDFTKPGRYVWYCPVGLHREQGMKGVITVAGGGQANGASTTDTTENQTTETQTTETRTTETDKTQTGGTSGSGSSDGGSGGSAGGGY